MPYYTMDGKDARGRVRVEAGLQACCEGQARRVLARSDYGAPLAWVVTREQGSAWPGHECDDTRDARPGACSAFAAVPR